MQPKVCNMTPGQVWAPEVHNRKFYVCYCDRYSIDLNAPHGVIYMVIYVMYIETAVVNVSLTQQFVLI